MGDAAFGLEPHRTKQCRPVPTPGVPARAFRTPCSGQSQLENHGKPTARCPFIWLVRLPQPQASAWLSGSHTNARCTRPLPVAPRIIVSRDVACI
jgi:hypothetical protein